ncbi:MAG: hypothetical protein ACK5RG_21325 [Cyclobacteriaceae bacterium]|nr:hypothetical protein [Flammeovirgaceae bacterium]
MEFFLSRHGARETPQSGKCKEEWYLVPLAFNLPAMNKHDFFSKRFFTPSLKENVQAFKVLFWFLFATTALFFVAYFFIV